MGQTLVFKYWPGSSVSERQVGRALEELRDRENGELNMDAQDLQDE